MYYPQMFAFSFHTFFVLLYQFLSKKQSAETMLTLPSLFIQLANVNNKMNEKRSQEYQSMDLEYITGKINSHILDFFGNDFVI